MRRPLPLLLVAVMVAGTLAGCFGDGTSDWAYRMTGVRALQAQDLTGNGVRVAIIDTGLDVGHPALGHVNVVAWRDYVNARPEPYDDQGHGTHVTGIVVGRGGNLEGRLSGFDLRGAATGVDLIIVKAISNDQSGRAQDVVSGIDFARQNQADIICLSLGSRPGPLNLISDDMRDAINRALNQGILVVASAGNTGPDNDDVESPANVEGIIAVGAIDERRAVAGFSAKGHNAGFIGGIGQRTDPHKKPEVVAPGVGIKGAWTDGGWATASGTSQAAPFVCGGLALILEQNPPLKADNRRAMVDRVKSAIKETAQPVPGQRTPHDDRAGYGVFSADRLAQALL